MKLATVAKLFSPGMVDLYYLIEIFIFQPEEGEKAKFAVCVKGLDFPEEDLSVRLVEWIELLTTLGANKIFFYQLEIHPNVSKVSDETLW